MRCRALLLLLALAAAAAGEGWRAARPGYAWSFPRDHHAHAGYRTEWWYVTGHLASAGEPPRRFGYQVTFFRVGLLPARPEGPSAWATKDLVMGHAALTEVDAGRHRLSEVLRRAMPLLGGFGAPGDPVLAWVRAPTGTAGTWELRLEGEDRFAFRTVDRGAGLGLRLSLRAARPRVLQGPGGYSRKGAGEGAASMYYSYTRLETAGEVEVDGETIPVTGSSWMDREFASDSLGPDQVGWDWFALQLADGRDLMLYVLRRRDGSVDHARGTVVARDGSARYLDREDYSVEVTARWTSPGTGATYPAGWRLRVPDADLDLRVEPLVADQENRPEALPDLYYWEGAVAVRDAAGDAAGRGYVELTGYGDARRPGF